MKLYVCRSTAVGPIGQGGHPCGKAYHALRAAGHDPEVVKVRGAGFLPDTIFNRSAGRREVRSLTGASAVPVLVADDGEVVTDSKRIMGWAASHPSPAAAE